MLLLHLLNNTDMYTVSKFKIITLVTKPIARYFSSLVQYGRAKCQASFAHFIGLRRGVTTLGLFSCIDRTCS